MHRTSGLLLHPTSLPGPYGIGDLGPSAYAFVDFLVAAGQGLWQVLPLGPTGYGDSPYQCLSAFAGNPLLISPDLLVQDGWLDDADLECAGCAGGRVDFGRVTDWKQAMLVKAYVNFQQRADASIRREFARFCEKHHDWLEDYVAFRALKAQHALRPWTDWPEPLALRDAAALAEWRRQNEPDLAWQRFIQFLFFRQWHALRGYANARGIHLIGDVPIFVAQDSSEVWTHPEWFQLDERGRPTVVAGVPPDYFSDTGQRWGNPLYRWDQLKDDGYRFWVDRLRGVLDLVDLVRIDHFRGFAGYWEIQADEPTAINGRWVDGPGMDLFRTLAAALGSGLPLIAEDLGVITEDVEALRDDLGLPGMAILQFAFESAEGGFGRSQYLPHNFQRNLVVYTGTHDNDTFVGWWAEADETVRHNLRRYLNTDGDDVHWDAIRAAIASVACYALFPLQDLLALGNEARMNRPGSQNGNWTWRFDDAALSADLARRLHDMSEIYGRQPYPVSAGQATGFRPDADSASN